MLYLSLFLLAVSGTLADNKAKFYNLDKLGKLFDEFIQEYHKEYNGNDEEYIYRFNIFKDNVEEVNKLNNKGNGVYRINEFSDLTYEEFSKIHLGFQPVDDSFLANRKPAPNMTAPAKVDWRDSNVINHVKNQGNCGSCYVFSAIACIESQYAMKTGQLISLSEQQGLDCDNESSGCGGGWPHCVMDALKNEGGVMAEADYPYHASKGQCNTDTSRVRVQVTGHNSYNLNDEEALKNVVATYGPTSIAMYFPSSLSQYYGDVVSPEDCTPGTNANHAVLLVGYSTDENGTPYWIIKNSHGGSWGDGGYLYLKMGNNLCNVLGYAVVATL